MSSQIVDMTGKKSENEAPIPKEKVAPTQEESDYNNNNYYNNSRSSSNDVTIVVDSNGASFFHQF